jgi:hypothetical protein
LVGVGISPEDSTVKVWPSTIFFLDNGIECSQPTSAPTQRATSGDTNPPSTINGTKRKKKKQVTFACLRTASWVAMWHLQVPSSGEPWMPHLTAQKQEQEQSDCLHYTANVFLSHGRKKTLDFELLISQNKHRNWFAWLQFCSMLAVSQLDMEIRSIASV